MELTEELKYTIARVISNQKLSESEKQSYYIWEMEPMEMVGESHVVWLN
jgi:hypothetical protein